ncbi:MAG: hypothetical protein RMJ56_12590 [Gemmataceae bacterium]|nr:hypothetical protein [Gemmata sp.]MDW8198431.1 hypothetical protein [Gemmataceae bacterium]
MVRMMMTMGLVLLGGSMVAAQPPRSGSLVPLGPGIMPGSPWGPGMPFANPLRPAQGANPVLPNNPLILLPWVFPGYFPWGIAPGYGYPWVVIPRVPAWPPVAGGEPRRGEPVRPLSGEAPAQLTVQFPAAAEIWVAGQKMPGAACEEYVLVSPVLPALATHTFEIRARWTQNGKIYQARRTVTLAAGERSRLLVVSGDEVQE